MVHHRINEKEPNPNPHINFISALTAQDATEDSARQLLRALAAQVRPIMKSHGFTVNSLEEYEHNQVFAGRNWNAGETIELVLRRADRTFLPTFWLMSTLCHELAHIKHMHHGPTFQSLWRQLQREVGDLQNRGYYGDGYWSSGMRLSDSMKVAGEGIEPGDLPEYMCGGAHSRQRPASVRRRRQPPSGRQTKRRKAGSRVTSKAAFKGEGRSLATGAEGSSFKKRATSKRARDERTLAVERRIRALQSEEKASTSKETLNSWSGSESDDGDVVVVSETDSQRRQTLLSSDTGQDLGDLKSGALLEAFRQGLGFGIEDQDCELHAKPGSSAVMGKVRETHLLRDIKPADKLAESKAGDKARGMILNKAPQDLAPILREKEASKQWACLVCTLRNEPQHLACSACATPRGEDEWAQK